MEDTSDKLCPGCGAVLHSLDPKQPGYVPPEVLERDGKAVCQRCYRIIHYGREERVKLDIQSFLAVVSQAVESASLVLVILDVVDFEGSSDPVLFQIARSGDSVGVLANKIDLLPPKVPQHEVQDWVRERLREKGAQFQFVYGISGEKGQGLDRLEERLRNTRIKGKVAILGATNVGKSTVIRRLTGVSTSETGPTVSRFPGTTLGRIELPLPGLPATVVDTPGLVPQGRLTELLCESCRALLVPSKQLKGKLLQLRPGRSVMFGRLASFANVGTGDSVAIVYCASDLFHETGQARALSLLEDPPAWAPSCSRCTPLEFTTESVTVPPGFDLAVSGLGWLSVRKTELHCRLTLPTGVNWSLRPNLVGVKK